MVNIDDKTNFIINHEWKVLKKIGSGSFGEIYSCVNISSGQEAAVKLVKNIRKYKKQLYFEHKALKLLKDGEGIVKVFGFDISLNSLFVALFMEQLGPNLEDLRIYCNGKFSLKTTLMLADQMIRRIEFLHNSFIIHRDIKPDNFLMGNGKLFNIVYIIDFGLAKHYINPISKEHLPFRKFQNLTGTAKYCSINAHAGFEQSRRDDLESLGYVFIYFLKGSLPWQNIDVNNKYERFKLIYEEKQSLTLEKLCQHLPMEFMAYFQYCKCLDFQERPKYDYLRKIFWDLLDKHCLKYDFQFDWIIKTS